MPRLPVQRPQDQVLDERRGVVGPDSSALIHPDPCGANAIVLPPGVETNFHFHDEQEELYFVHRGEIEFTFNGDVQVKHWENLKKWADEGFYQYGGPAGAPDAQLCVVIVGATIIECFALSAYVEENAYRQYMAMQIGEPYVFSEAEQKVTREKLWTPSLFQKTWDHYYSKLKT